jgi:hypothetical protein
MVHPIFHQFTFGKDAAATIESVERVRQLYPAAHVYVWEDALHPLPQATRDRIERDGTRRVRPTFFPRNGNLKGLPCFEGMISCYAASLQEHPEATHILKFDADSLIVRSTSIDEAITDGVYAASWAHSTWAFSGIASVASRECVFDTYAHLLAGKAIPGAPLLGNEDLLLGAAAHYLADGREVRLWKYDPAGGFAASYQYERAKVSLAEYLRRFEVVTFGSRDCMKCRGEPDCDRRLKTAYKMSEARRLLA